MTEQVLWAVLVGLPLLVMVVVALFDLIWRRTDFSPLRRLGWGAVIVFLPLIGVLLYALFRTPSPAAGKSRGEQEEAQSTMLRLEGIIEDHDSGTLSDEQYAEQKAELFGL